MQQPRNKTVSFKVSVLERDGINKKFSQWMNETQLSKPDLLMHIMTKYEEIGTIRPVETGEIKSVQWVLDKVDCDDLHYEDFTFFCLEKFEGSKTRKVVGEKPNTAFINCSACQRSKERKEEFRIKKLREKYQLEKWQQFFKQFEQITSGGLDITFCYCLYLQHEGIAQLSGDGRFLKCHMDKNADGDPRIVSIIDFCKQRVDNETHRHGCRFYNEREGKAPLTTKQKQDLVEGLPELPEPIVEETPDPEPRKTIEVESKVIK